MSQRLLAKRPELFLQLRRDRSAALATRPVAPGQFGGQHGGGGRGRGGRVARASLALRSAVARDAISQRAFFRCDCDDCDESAGNKCEA
jgi:hypothetical protein